MIQIGNLETAKSEHILEIKDVRQVVKCRYAIGAKDELTRMLIQRHDVSFKFFYNEFKEFNKGDYLVYKGSKYTILDDYTPTEINDCKFEYDLVFHAEEMLWQDIQMFYTNTGLPQSEYGMTGDISYFAQLVKQNVDRYNGNTNLKINVDDSDLRLVTFQNNTNVFAALGEICRTFDKEWLFDNGILTIRDKFTHGSPIEYKLGESLLKVSRREGENAFKYNKVLALGSNVNLSRSYRGELPMIGDKRLRIPASKGEFIQIGENLLPSQIKEATIIFNDIFPKRVGTIEAVEEVEYKQIDEDTNEETTLIQYKIKDLGINFKEEYLLPDKVLSIVFESGHLAGLHFEVEFHKDKFSATDNSQNYEIIASKDYGVMLPNETLKPQEGDKYILYNFDISLVDEQYTPEAEELLYTTALDWLKEAVKDKGVYECEMLIQYARDNQINSDIGQAVKLVGSSFAENNRLSRVMGYSKNLLDNSIATYTIGDNKAYSSKSLIESRIQALEGAEVGGGSSIGGNIYIIKQFDATRPTDYNVYSASATNAMYFNKQTGDTVQGDSMFMRNVQTQGLNISDVFQNSTFTSGALGSGFQFKRDTNGDSYGEIDHLRVRKELLVTQLTIDEIKSVGGSVLLSLASLEATNVEDKGTYYRVYYDNQDGKLKNQFAVNDQAICQTFNGGAIKRYWRLITSVGANYIDLSKTDAEAGSKLPEKGDAIIQLGNRTNINRQSAILLSSYGSDSPSIKQYGEINNYSMEGKEVTKISPSGNYFEGDFVIKTHNISAPIYKDRNLFVNGTQYYKNDRVSWKGSLWVCLVDTKVVPNETSTQWRKETSGQTDIDNSVNQLRTETSAEFEVLNDKIESTVESVNKIEIGGVNLVDNSKQTHYVGGSGSPSNEAISNLGIYAELTEGERYTFQCKTDGVWGNVVGVDSVKAFVLKDWSTAAGDYVQMRSNPYTFTAPKTGKFYIRIDSNKGDIRHSFWEFQIEKGNKATDWRLSNNDINKSISNAQNTANNAQNAANDAQSTANNAQNTADSKIKTYRQDPKPTAPSRGFTIGDIWQKITPVSESGAITGDTDKDIFLPQYRWNGSDWAIQVWNSTKTNILQTAEQVKITAEKTGINQLGQNETLYGLIDVMPDKIQLAVENIKIGGVNLFKGTQLMNQPLWVAEGTSKIVKYENNSSLNMGVINQPFPSINVSTLMNLQGFNMISKEDVFTISVMVKATSPNQEIGVTIGTSRVNWQPIELMNNVWQRVVWTFNGNGDSLSKFRLESSTASIQNPIYFAELQIEKGNKATGWSVSPSDIENEITSLTLTENKISLAGKTIELKGSTIADSIEADDLVIGDASTLSEFKVSKNGSLLARGSNQQGESLIIDSDNKVFRIVSNNSATEGGSASGQDKSTIEVSSQKGGFEARGDNKVAIISTSGVFANYANQGGHSSVTGISDKSALVGLGHNSVARDYNPINRIEYNNLVGVFGRAQNSYSGEKAPDYGGMFYNLCAKGFITGLRRIIGSDSVSDSDTYISCDNTKIVYLSLPSTPLVGRCIYVRVNKFNIDIVGGRNNIIVGFSSPIDRVTLEKGKLYIIVFDGENWLLNVVN